MDNAYWTVEAAGSYYTGTHTYQLSSKGTYKAVITFTVYGSGGAADVITSEIEKSY